MELKNYVTSAQISFEFGFCTPAVAMLYQPIMGGEALALYILLCHEYRASRKLKKEVISPISNLLSITQLSHDKFNKIKQRLEAVGLIRTFWRKNSNCFNFKLRAPLTPSEFFKNKNFYALLKDKTSVKVHDKLCSYFNISGDHERELNVSSSFAETFAGSYTPDVSNQWGVLFASVNKHLEVHNLGHNHYLPYKNDIIEKVNFYYIDKNDLKTLIQNSYVVYDNKTTFSFSTFSNLVEEAYLDSCQTNEINKSLKTAFKNSSSALTEKIHEMETINNSKYVSMLFNGYGKVASSTEEKLIHQLSINYKLNSGVINCLSEFVFMTNNHTMPEDIVYKLAEFLQKYRIKKARAAILKLKSFKLEQNYSPQNKKIQLISYAANDHR